ncbi:MAG: hypothetical protein GXO48_05145 [Chlorobi bacterium]|nr:hypothetical protein [Chlorobiota bacterium]
MLRKVMIVLGSMFAIIVNAQENFCATELDEESKEVLRGKPVEMFKHPSLFRFQELIIPLHYIILCWDDGRNCSSLYVLLEALCRMDTQYFEPHGIGFMVRDESFTWVWDSVAWFGTDASYTRSIADQYSKIRYLNILMTGSCRQCGPCACGCMGCCGMGVVSVARSCANQSFNLTKPVISHEIGHWLGLPHTFDYGYCRECVDRSNCYECGDGFCDTPADYVPVFTCPFDSTVVEDSSACPLPVDTMNPDGTLIMGYSYGTSCNPRKFSYEQGIFMHYYAMMRRPWLYSVNVPNRVSPNPVPLTIPYRDSLSWRHAFVSWNSDSNATMYAVSVFSINSDPTVTLFDTVVTDTFTYVRLSVPDTMVVVAVKPLNELYFCTSWTYDTLIIARRLYTTVTTEKDTLADSLFTVVLHARNGSMPYEYRWLTGSDTTWHPDSMFNNVPEGLHHFEVRDVAGNLNRVSVMLQLPQADTTSSDSLPSDSTPPTHHMRPEASNLIIARPYSDVIIVISSNETLSSLELLTLDGRVVQTIRFHSHNGNPVYVRINPKLMTTPLIGRVYTKSGNHIAKILLP